MGVRRLCVSAVGGRPGGAAPLVEYWGPGWAHKRPGPRCGGACWALADCALGGGDWGRGGRWVLWCSSRAGVGGAFPSWGSL